jgi:hypothetical protein
VCGTGFWRRGEDVVTGGIACLDEGAVCVRLVMGCGPPSSWRIFQGTLGGSRSPGAVTCSHRRPPATTQRLSLISRLNVHAYRIKECGRGTAPTSAPLLRCDAEGGHWLFRCLQRTLQQPLLALRKRTACHPPLRA